MELHPVKIENEELLKILDALDALRAVEGVKRVELVSRDGLPLIPDQSINALPAMAATIIATAETVEAVLGQGLPKRVIVETEKGNLIIRGAGHKVLLVVIAEPEANIQLIAVEIERAARIAKEIL